MARFVWSTNPLAMQRLRSSQAFAPLTAAELARLGIPVRKIPRVRQELARLSATTDLDRALLPALARQIARQLL